MTDPIPECDALIKDTGDYFAKLSAKLDRVRAAWNSMNDTSDPVKCLAFEMILSCELNPNSEYEWCDPDPSNYRKVVK